MGDESVSRDLANLITEESACNPEFAEAARAEQARLDAARVPNLAEPAAQQPLSPGSEPCTSLRDAVAERMTTRWRERARSGVEDTAEGHCVDLANVVVGLLGELAAESVCDRRRCLLDDQPWNRHQPRRGGGR